MTEQLLTPEPHLTEAQEAALSSLCDRYHVRYNPDHYHHTFDLPEGWAAGWLGGTMQQRIRPTIYIGVSPEGEVSS